MHVMNAHWMQFAQMMLDRTHVNALKVTKAEFLHSVFIPTRYLYLLRKMLKKDLTVTWKSRCPGDGFDCSDTDECEDPDLCAQHGSCKNTDFSYECICDEGYEGDGKECVDVDECQKRTHECAPNADCTNSLGSYLCDCWPGFSGGFNARNF